MGLWAALCALLLCHAAWPQAAPSPADAITMARAVQLATGKNPTLLAAREHLEAVRANEITARLRQNPELSLSGADVSLPADNPASPYSYSANVSRLFERGQKRRWRIEGTRAYSQAGEQQYKDQERQVLFQVRQNFVQVLQSQAVLDLAKQDLESWNKTLELSKVRLDVGDISGTEYARLDLQEAQFESDYENAVQSLRQNSDQLQVLLGIEHPSATFAIAGDLTPPAFDKTLEQIEQLALAARPDLLAAQATVDATAADHRLAVAGGTTDPTLAGEYDRSGTYNSFGFSVNLPLRFFDRNQGEKSRTAFEADSSRFALISARNQVMSDVDQAWAGYEGAAHLASRYNTHYRDESQKVRDNLEFSYQHGNATLLDFLDSLRDFRQTQLNGVNANAQVWLALCQLTSAANTEMVP
jgi:cobalt-zinc-cadmium efflux system outer membrane protein